MSRVALTGLLTIELPEATLRFTDGGFIEYNGETYRAKDDTFGTIQSVQPLSEGVGDSVPALSISMLPPDTSAVADLTKPGHQTSQVQFVLAEYDVDAGTINSADVLFTGQIDQSVLTVGKGKRELAMSVVSLAERLFEGNTGNSLNPTFHKSVWPGETGHDNATGLAVPVAWGVERPGTGSGYGGGRGGGGGGGENGFGQFPYPRYNRH